MAVSPTRELSQAIADISERMLTQFDSANKHLGLSIVKAEHGDLIADLAPRLADEWVRQLFAKELAGRNTRGKAAQQELPGIGPIDNSITISDGEGGVAYKLVGKATADELVWDEALMKQNAETAQAAYVRAQVRNSVLLPVMKTQGFEFAAQAIVWLQRPSAGAS